ncbi:MAG: Imm26 family immunity protein [Clostridiales bacterium]|nr:Imm26 family immunity protein [Clostridiales bacterium]
MSDPNNKNLARLKWEERYDRQPQEIKDKLDNFRNSDFQLRMIKRKRPELNVGDVFLLSPREDIYFYGKLLKTNIKTVHKDTFVEGKYTVFIFKCKTNRITLDDFAPNYDDLLIDPCIVDVAYWQRGFFYNVGNIPLTDFEKSLDYGFYNLPIFPGQDGWFCTEEGERLNRQPRIFGIHGITTITGVASEIEQELIINPALVDFKQR